MLPDDHNIRADTTEVALQAVSNILLDQNNSLSIATLPKYPANIERVCWQRVRLAISETDPDQRPDRTFGRTTDPTMVPIRDLGAGDPDRRAANGLGSG